MRIVLRLLSFLLPYKRLLLVAYLALIGSTLMHLALPRLLGESIDKVLEQGEFSFLVYVGIAIVGVTLFRGAFAFIENYLRESLAQRATYDMRKSLYDHLQSLSFAYHDTQQTGQLMSRATADVENVRRFISMGVIRASYLLVLVGVVAALLLTIDWALALMSLSFIPVIVIRGGILNRKLRAIWTRAQRLTGELGTIVQESLSGIRVVKAFARQDFEDRKFSEKAAELTGENLQAARVQAGNTPLMAFMFTSIIALMLWFGGRQVIQGQITAGQLTQFILYLAMLQMPVRMTGMIINMFARAVSSGERIFEVLDARSPVQEKEGAVPLGRVQGHVTVEGVAFQYDGMGSTLRDITFDAPPGQVVALLGATGSGKSTLVNLLPRFYDVSEGRVLIDGTDVRDVTLESLRRNVGIVQQDIFLFSATIRDNIAYGALGASAEQVELAAKVARLHDFIVGLPDGYDTWVGERGITLSGGQKQRVAIARTLLTDPPILILDDSTSSVDTRTEHQIRQALAALVKGRTTFVIAQRLSTVKSADLILVLQEGLIAQRGRHEELLEQEGLYREIYEMQLRPQEEAGQLSGLREEATA